VLPGRAALVGWVSDGPLQAVRQERDVIHTVGVALKSGISFVWITKVDAEQTVEVGAETKYEALQAGVRRQSGPDFQDEEPPSGGL
jgi:hypothetical protein